MSYGTGVKVVWKNITATCSTVGSAGTNLYDFWIRRTSPTTISFVWGGTGTTVSSPSTLTFNFIFTKY